VRRRSGANEDPFTHSNGALARTLILSEMGISCDHPSIQTSGIWCLTLSLHRVYKNISKREVQSFFQHISSLLLLDGFLWNLVMPVYSLICQINFIFFFIVVVNVTSNFISSLLKNEEKICLASYWYIRALTCHYRETFWILDIFPCGTSLSKYYAALYWFTVTRISRSIIRILM
jgi:hypothetical protein